MREGPSFQGSAATGGRGGRLITAIVVGLVVTFVGIAIAKPWGSPVAPAPSARLPLADVTPPPSPIRTTVRVVASAAPPVAVGPLPVAFTTPLPPASATWTGLTWRRLAPDDPLNLVRSVQRWRGGFVAVGWYAGRPEAPVWTSTDGRQWDPVPFDTPSTFWSGTAVLGLAEQPAGLVALTETVEFCGGPCSLTYVLPVVSWTSPDGRAWTPRLLPPEWFASPPGRPPLFAAGPAGLLAASRGPAAVSATSPDGSHWLLPEVRLPARFALDDLRGSSTGYVAVGRWMTTDGRSQAASLSSSDGLHWSTAPTILPTTPGEGPAGVGPAAVSLVVGRDGIMAVGSGGTAAGTTVPGPTTWWRSPDGRRWTALPGFPPLGPTTCGGACGRQPNGALVGDGTRLMAVRGGAADGAWTSLDGLSWSRLAMAGEIPPERATQAALLPGGLLLSDGTTTWFGEAIAP